MLTELAAPLGVVQGNFAAAIDLGFNSFHILVAELFDGYMRPIHCWGEKVQLAEGLEQQEHLSSSAKQRAFECLKRFAHAIAEVPTTQVRVVGTEALRRASDRNEFVAEAEVLLGVPIKIISGEEEACLIYQGVIQGKKARQLSVAESVLILDIGGGSAEMVLGKGDQVIACASLPLGCVSYSRRFFPQQISDRAVFDQVLQALRKEIQPGRKTFAAGSWQQVIGTAGTALAIEAVLQAKGWAKGGITRSGLERLAELLCQGKSVEALQLPGLGEERFDIVIAGVAIMLALFQTLDIEQMVTSVDSLREGLIYSLVDCKAEP